MIYTYLEVGTWRKPFGTGGQLRIQAKNEWADQVADAKVLFAMLRGTYVPYFVEKVLEQGGIIVKVEEIDSPEDGLELSGKPLYMREQDLDLDTVVTGSVYDLLIGLQVIDKGRRGVIQEVVDYPQQKMAKVLTPQGSEVLVPIAPELILHIDEEVAEMQLPDNFWEIFGD